MSMHLHRAIEDLKKRILSMSADVEEQVRQSIRAIIKRDRELAEQIIRRDNEIDLHELEIEEECLKTLALHQPVAIDLRFIVAILKINNSLERIGDHAVNIAEGVLEVAEIPPMEMTFDLEGMAGKAENMLKLCLDALVTQDVEKAQQVRDADDEVDDLLALLFKKGSECLQKRQCNADYTIRLISVAKQLERIADLATNIAEDVIYLVDGVIVRHSYFEE